MVEETLSPTASLAVYEVGGNPQIHFYSDAACNTELTHTLSSFGECRTETLQFNSSISLRVGYSIGKHDYWTDGNYVKVSEFAVNGACSGTPIRTSYVPAIGMPGAGVTKTMAAQFCTSSSNGVAIACAGSSPYKYTITGTCATDATAASANPPALTSVATCHDGASTKAYECVDKATAENALLSAPTAAPTSHPTNPEGVQPWHIGMGVSLALFFTVLTTVLVLIVNAIILKYVIKIPSVYVARGEDPDEFDALTDKIVWTDDIVSIGGTATKDSRIYKELAKQAKDDTEGGSGGNFKLVVTKTHGEKPFCDFPACADDDDDE
jgi:hypothetical protein